MSAAIFIHPAMKAVDVQAFCDSHQVRIEYVSTPGKPRFRAVPASTFQVFSCNQCGWIGDEPNWFDLKELAPPSVGDVPLCPDCNHHELHLTPESVARA